MYQLSVSVEILTLIRGTPHHELVDVHHELEEEFDHVGFEIFIRVVFSYSLPSSQVHCITISQSQKSQNL